MKPVRKLFQKSIVKPVLKHRLALSLVLALLLSAACKHNALSVEDFSVRLEQPLTISWSGKENGTIFPGEGVFSARSSHSADWRLTISSDNGTRTVIDHTLFQKVFAQSWTTFPGSQDAGRDWMVGDVITAVIELSPPVHPDDAHKTTVSFTLGEPCLPEEDN